MLRYCLNLLHCLNLQNHNTEKLNARKKFNIRRKRNLAQIPIFHHSRLYSQQSISLLRLKEIHRYHKKSTLNYEVKETIYSWMHLSNKWSIEDVKLSIGKMQIVKRDARVLGDMFLSIRNYFKIM
jgi:hypothetical protein